MGFSPGIRTRSSGTRALFLATAALLRRYYFFPGVGWIVGTAGPSPLGSMVKRRAQQTSPAWGKIVLRGTVLHNRTPFDLRTRLRALLLQRASLVPNLLQS
ncbi:unnamed protein product [Pylaiella littoralis]